MKLFKDGCDTKNEHPKMEVPDFKIFCMRPQILREMRCVGAWLICIHALSCDSSPSTPFGPDYTIGVGITGDVGTFLNEWRPLLVNYLTAKVASQYNPPLKFNIIPVDYSVNSSTSVLIPNGELDFVCKSILV